VTPPWCLTSHRPVREDRDDHFGFQREAEPQKSDRCKRHPRGIGSKTSIARQAVNAALVGDRPSSECRSEIQARSPTSIRFAKERRWLCQYRAPKFIGGEVRKTKENGPTARQIFDIRETPDRTALPSEADRKKRTPRFFTGQCSARCGSCSYAYPRQWPGCRPS